jgi:hypothetical protein
MFRKLRLKKLNKNQIKLIGLVVLFLTLPLILSTLYFIQDTRIRAALPDQLESESGVLSSSGVTKQSDSRASGGQYIRFTRSANNPTPTSAPTPTIPSNAVYVPDSIDSTGATDVQQQLNDFIRNTPDGSTIVFKKDGTYRLNSVLKIEAKKYLNFEGNGATLKLTSINPESSYFYGAGIFIATISENITIRSLKIVGDHVTAGTAQTCCSREGQKGIAIWGGKNILLEYLDISYVGGDCFGVHTHAGEVWSDGVTIRNSTCRLTGRMGSHINGARNVTFENNYFDKIGYAVFASEPNSSKEGITNLIIKNNTIGTYSLTNQYDGALYYYYDAWWSDGPTDMSGITITGNTIEGNANGRTGKMMGLDVRIYENGTGLREKVTVANNVAKKAVPGPVMTFESVRGVTVTGNTQPLTSGSLVSSPGSTNVNVSNNTTN